MRQVNSPPTNLWQSRGRYRGFGSKGWVPTSSVQRLGAIIIGMVFVVGGLMMIGTSFLFKREFQAEISSPPIAQMVTLFAVALALAVASFVMWLGGRLLAGCSRPIRKG